MIKEYFLENDKNCYIIENNKKVKKNLTIHQKINIIINGKSLILKRTDNYIIYKVLKSYELKLVVIIKYTDNKYKVYESICPEPTKNEYLKLIINFNNQLRKEGITGIGVNFEKVTKSIN